MACDGAPRDLGLDQGRACREALRARFGARSRWRRARLRAGWSRGQAASLARDLRRHFPHHAEQLAGLAVGAGVPRGWLLEQLAEALCAEPAATQPAAAALAGPRALLARALMGEHIVRRSRPEGLFASVDVTDPALPSALIGVNERGLGVVVVVDGAAAARCSAPAALLAQDCLERFATLDAALEWCLARPGGGRGWLLLADAGGEVAGLEVSGDARRVLRPAEGVLAREGSASGDLAKALRNGAPSAPAELVRRMPDAIVVDAAERRLLVGGRPFSP